MADNVQFLMKTITVPAGGTYNFDIDFASEGIKKFGASVSVTYQASAETTGCSLNLFTAPGLPDPACVIGQAPYNLAIPCVPGGSRIPNFGSSSYAVTLGTITPSSGSPQTVTTNFFLDDIHYAWQDWVRFQFVNNDLTNSCTVSLTATIGNYR